MFHNGGNRRGEFLRFSADEIFYDSPKPKIMVQPLPKNIRTNKKLGQMQESKKKLDRYSEIQRENRDLIEKIRKNMKVRKNSYISNDVKLISPSPRSRMDDRLKKTEIRSKNTQPKVSLANFPPVQITPNLRVNLSIDSVNSYYVNQSHSVSIDRSRRLSPLVVEIKETAYKKNLVLDGRSFLVEVTKGRNTVKIVVSDAKNFTRYSIEIERREALEFMGGRENWEALVRNLQLDGTELSLYENDF